jgi:acyl transferase domain-containing protein/acyl carrier protein
MSGRWPGAANADEFWANLCGGVESIRPYSDDEIAAAGFDPSITKLPNFVNAGAAVDNADMFDAAFFGINPREAQALDPQRRVFLECAWHALEDAGQVPAHVDGAIGLFAGSSLSNYLQLVQANSELVAAVGTYQTLIGCDKDHLTTYTAYKLNLTGPAVTVQTACSTSLVAVAMACQSLLNQECDLALAGGVSIRTPQHFGYFYEEGGILSPDGHCRAFDAAAKGTVGGNGVGIVVLKRLADALRGRDRIRAVILGSAINNDGSVKVGYTAPSVEGQASVVATAMALAGVEPETLGYIEAHGTATPLGDPIEIAALTQVFGDAGRRGFCGIGSVKTNVGHLDAAAGVTGLIKAACCVEHGILAPSLHFEQANPAIDLTGSPFYVQDRLAEWNSNGLPRRAGVSAFGIGGTNAHAVLEQAPQRPDSGPSRPYQLLVLSARSETALDRLTEEFEADLVRNSVRPLADIAFSLATGRQAMPYRRYLVRPSGSADVPALTGSAAAIEGAAAVFLFPGQGAQHVGMGRDLYEREAIFRSEFDRCAEILEPHLGTDLRPVIFAADASEESLRQTGLAQPALFATEYSLARLLMSWGITPAAMIGHSLGEYVAACLAGVLSLEDALAVVALRGMLMQDTAPGAMLAAPLSEDEALPLLDSNVELAAVNGPSQTVFSGPADAMAGFANRLAERDIPFVRLRTSHAFHSPTMEPALSRFGAMLRSISLRAPKLPYVENLSGGWQTAAAADPKYWVDHGRHTVRFSAGCRTLLDAGYRTFIEVGPGSTLSKLMEPQLRATGAGVVAQAGPDQRALLEAVGRLWIHGVAVDWRKYYREESRNRVSLPLYPFEWQRYDASPSPAAVPRIDWAGRNPDLATWFYEPTWKATARPDLQPDAAVGPSLVFLDNQGLGSAVVSGLPDVITVVAGDSFTQLAPGAFRIRPEERADYEALLNAIEPPARILHFWNVGPAPAESSSVFYRLLCLAQALGQRQPPAQVRIVSTAAWAVNGDEVIEPAKGLLAGPCRIAPMEHPAARWRNIDVAAPDGPSATLVEQLRTECLVDSPDPVVALRGRRRWTEIPEPIPAPADPARAPLRARGVYLITGGLSGIGLAIAGFLAREYQARLILIGRSAPSQATQQVIAEMEAAGAEVLAASADVTDVSQMRAVLADARARFGELHGAIHSAGIAGGGLIELKDRTAADAILAAKVQGTLVLDELLRDAPLDFFACCSSLTAILGGIGQVDYCSANAFLDAYAQSAASRHDRRTVSIQWDAWAEVGMAANTPVPAGMEAERAAVLKNAILPAEGVEAFRRALACGLPQVSISTLNLPLRMAQARWISQAAAPAFAEPSARHPRPALRTEYLAPATEMEELIAKIWQDLFGLDRIGARDNFFDLGGHSLMATQMATRVRVALGVEITVRHVFEAPTISELATVLEKMADESAELTSALDLIEKMTDEQVRAQLEQS